MSVKLYMDVHVKRAVVDGLKQRGVDVHNVQPYVAPEHIAAMFQALDA